MDTLPQKIPQLAQKNGVVKYRGKQSKIGNSQGFRLESAFFRSHPEFSGDVTATVVGPRQVLLTAEPEEHEDPVLDAFLDLLAKDMEAHPDRIRPMDEAQMLRDLELTKDVVVDFDEDLGEESLLG
jgi:antitoxin PrlF